MYAFINDQSVTEAHATISVSDLSILRSYGVFEFFRTVNYKPLFLHDHLDRFYRSAAGMFLEPVPERNKLESIIFELIERNKVPGAGVRIIFTGGYATDGFTVSQPNLIITQTPLHLPDAERFTNGIKIITHYHCREIPEIKSTNYTMGVWLQQAVRKAGVDDVLYHHANGVLEFPRANVFMVNAGNEVVTPLKGVLHGITRKNVLEIAGTFGNVSEREIFLEELKNASEVFLSSTTKRLLPVTEIDGIKIGTGKAGPITTKLFEAFLKLEQEYV